MLLAILLSLSSGQFFSQACKQGQTCNLATLRLQSTTSLGTCDTSTAGSLATYNPGAGTTRLFYCDGLMGLWTAVSQYTAGASPSVQIANITTRTIASGTITSGSALLGSGELAYGSSLSSVAGSVNLIDKMRYQCATAGTGAGNVTVNFRKLGTSAATVCSATVACTTAALAAAVLSCSAVNFAGTVAGYGSDQYGTTLDVSACTTPPADCVVTHSVYTN